MPDVIEEPTGEIWTRLKAHGVTWPVSDEVAMAEMAVAWKNAGLGFVPQGLTGWKGQQAWPDPAGAAFTSRVNKLSEVTVKVGQAMQELSGLAKGFADDVRHTKDQISKVVDETNWDYKWMQIKAAVNPFVDLNEELEKLCATVAKGINDFTTIMAARIRARGNGMDVAAPTIAKGESGNSLADRLGALATIAETASLVIPSPHLKIAAVALNAVAAALHVDALKKGVTGGKLMELATDLLVGRGAARDIVSGEIRKKATKEADAAWKYVTNNPTAQKSLQTGSNVVNNNGVLAEETQSGEQYKEEKDQETEDKLGIAIINEKLHKLAK
jgi:hypothetical protein